MMGHPEPLNKKAFAYDEPAASRVRVVHCARVFLLWRAQSIFEGHRGSAWAISGYKESYSCGCGCANFILLWCEQLHGVLVVLTREN